MEELFEVLGLDPDVPVAKAVAEVNRLKQNLDDKVNIIAGLQNQIKNYEEQIDAISSGVAEARVKDLVRKVQSETGYYVGKDHMDTLNRKAAQHLYAGEEERSAIWEDMKAHTLAYGAKVALSEQINSLMGSRDKGETKEDRRFNKAKSYVEQGKAKNWDHAMQLILKEEEEAKAETEE